MIKRIKTSRIILAGTMTATGTIAVAFMIEITVQAMKAPKITGTAAATVIMATGAERHPTPARNRKNTDF